MLEHGGPGVQHIGLLTPDIVTSVHNLANSGARFRHPPPTYYQLQNKIQDISTVGNNWSIYLIVICIKNEIYFF